MSELGDHPPPKFEYFEDRPRGTSSAEVMLRFFVVPMAVAAVLAGIGAAWLVWPALCAFAGWFWWSHRRRGRVALATLTVDEEVLQLRGSLPGGELDVLMEDLLEVRLDTKTIQRVQESPGPIPELRFIDATVSGEIDEARVELVLVEGETVLLSEERASYVHALDALNRLRRFLRAHGWVPEDEREQDSSQPYR